MTKFQSEISDTSAKSQAEYVEMLKKMTYEEKLCRVSQLCSLGRRMVLGHLLNQHKGCDEKELRYFLAERMHGKQVAKRFFKTPAVKDESHDI